MPLPRRVRRGDAERAADGLLRAGADRARRARARRRGAPGRRQFLRLGLDAGAGTPRRRPAARTASRDGEDIRTTHAIRLGLREIKGLREEDAQAIVERRRQTAAYDSVRDLWLRTGLSPRVLERLADADAFGSLGLSRRDALWAAKALGRGGDHDDDLPLFAFTSPRVSLSLTSPLEGRSAPEGRREGGSNKRPREFLAPSPTLPHRGEGAPVRRARGIGRARTRCRSAAHAAGRGSRSTITVSSACRCARIRPSSCAPISTRAAPCANETLRGIA